MPLSYDITSHIHGVGKEKAIRIFKGSKAFGRSFRVFLKVSTNEETVSAGERALWSIYGYKSNEEQIQLAIISSKRRSQGLNIPKNFTSLTLATHMCVCKVSLAVYLSPGSKLEQK